MGSQRVGHDWATSLSLFTFMHWRRKWQPTPGFLPGESEGWGSLVGCCLWGHRVGHDWSELAAAATCFQIALVKGKSLDLSGSPVAILTAGDLLPQDWGMLKGFFWTCLLSPVALRHGLCSDLILRTPLAGYFQLSVLWHHPNGRKQRRTKEPLDESERGKWKSWLKTQHSENYDHVPITSWPIYGETVETVTDFIFLGSKITADGDCSHEIKRRLLLERKVMTNLDSILKSRDITSPTKVHLIKAMVLPVVMYACESWTIKKAKHGRIDAFELWCWRRLLRVPWTARRSNQAILKEISPGCSLGGLMLKLKLQYFGQQMWRTDSLEKTLILGKIEGQGEGDDRGWDGWMASPTQWTWIWVNSRTWRWTGRPGAAVHEVAESDMTERLNWTDTIFLPHGINSFSSLSQPTSVSCKWYRAGSVVFIFDFFSLDSWLPPGLISLTLP